MNVLNFDRCYFFSVYTCILVRELSSNIESLTHQPR